MREVGNNFAFIVLRDFYGTTQLVIENEELFKQFKALNKECRGPSWPRAGPR